MLALEIIGVLLLATFALLGFRHLRLTYWGKDSNNPVQHTVKLPPRPGYLDEGRAGSAGSESLDSALADLRAPLSGTGTASGSAKEKRKRLFRGKADIRRAIIINELLTRKYE